jgi:hypothetical protein
MNKRSVRRVAPSDGFSRTKFGASVVALTIVAIVVLMGTGDVSRWGDDIEACTRYVDVVRGCYGEHAGERVASAMAKPPKGSKERAAMTARCEAQARASKNCGVPTSLSRVPLGAPAR